MFTQTESLRSRSRPARPITTACYTAAANGSSVFLLAEPMHGQLCRHWANGSAELPVTMQQWAAWMHAGVWSSAAAQLPLNLPCSHQEAEQKYESMGSTWRESYRYISELAAPSTTSCTIRTGKGAFLWTVQILKHDAMEMSHRGDVLNISFQIIKKKITIPVNVVTVRTNNST